MALFIAPNIMSRSKTGAHIYSMDQIVRFNIGDVSAQRQPTYEGDQTAILPPISQPPLPFGNDLDWNPRTWSAKKKSATAFFTLLSAFVATFGTPIYVAGIPMIENEFKISKTLAISPASLYAFGLGIGGLFATAASEIFGRRIVYRVTVPLSLLFTIVGGSAKTFATLAIARSLAGVFSGPCTTVGIGVLNDLWDVSLDKTGSMFAVFYAMVIIVATSIGPMASGTLVAHRSWRWTFWTSALLIGAMTVAAFVIPETYVPHLQRTRAKKTKLPVESRGSFLSVYLVSVGRPLHMLIVEPLILPSGLVLSVTQSIVFAYYVIYAILFEETYGFTQYQVGMAFVPVLVGMLLAIPVVAAFDKLTYQKAREHAIASGTVVKPEKRLYPAMLGVIILPVSLFWLAWTGRPDVPWIVPVLSGGLFGLAYVLNMLCFPIYNNDVYSAKYGASVMAATTFMRFMVSSAFPLFTAQMVRKLDFAWATSLLGFVTVAMIPIPWAFFKWGPVLRSRSRYLRDQDYTPYVEI